jgi:hypothetical protein
MLRWAHEMNGDWYSWGGYKNGGATTTGYGDPTKADGPERYVAVYRRVHFLFDSLGVTNVTWAWVPNIMWAPNDPCNNVRNYWPGSDVVDWIGMDGYNWGTSAPWSTWKSFESLFRGTYTVLTSLADKPFLIGEFASSEVGGDKAAWITDAYQTIQNGFPKIKMAPWFDLNKETDWRIASSPASLAAYRNAIANPYFLTTVLPIDNIPPTVVITAPVNGASYPAPATVVVKATASDDDGTVTKVALYNNATLVAEDLTAPYEWTLSALVAANYTLRAVATDNKNATAESSIAITVTDPSGNLLTNNAFSSGLSSWTGFSNATGGAVFSTENVGSNPAARLTLTDAGTQTWHIQFYQTLPLTAGKTYSFEFDARAETTGKKFDIFCEEKGLDYTGYFSQNATITAPALTWQHFSVGWVQKETVTAKVGWKLGTYGLSDCWFDNTELKEIGAPVNKPPVANAGADRTLPVATAVTLDGRASNDPDSGPAALTYAWTQIGGAAVSLTNATTAQPGCTPVSTGAYTFRLTVSDGAASATDDVTITVTAPVTNRLINGAFSNGLSSWSGYSNTAGLAAFSTESVNGNSAAHLTINGAGTQTWHIQFYQSIPLTAGRTYTFAFDARAETTGKKIMVFCEENGLDYTGYFSQTATISAAALTWQHFSVSWVQNETVSAKVGWKLGTYGLSDVWLDNAVLTDNDGLMAMASPDSAGGSVSVATLRSAASKVQKLDICAAGSSALQFTLPEPGTYRLAIFSLQGSIVGTVNRSGNGIAGLNTVPLSLPRGTYIMRLSHKSATVQKTMRVIR